MTSCITIKIRYADFNTFSKQLKIPYTSADHLLIPQVEKLFEQLYDRRMLVRLVGVTFSDLAGGNYQINLFDDTQQAIRLYQAIDSVKKQYGERAVMRAAAVKNLY